MLPLARRAPRGELLTAAIMLEATISDPEAAGAQ
jgi:hypothetical protein